MSEVLAPRYQVTMNGITLEGVISLTVSVALSFQVGTFSFTKGFVPGDKFPRSWWAATSTKTMRVVISLSTDGITYTPVMTGNVDNHSWNMLHNEVSVQGRDLAALLLDTRVTSTSRNQTASEIVSAIAAKHGLTANVTATKGFVGRYAGYNYDDTNAGNFNHAINEWDLVCRLGSQAGIIPYVLNDTLYFNPPANSPPTFVASVSYDKNGMLISNVMDLTLSRNMTAAHDVIVTYRSWHADQKETYTGTYRTSTKEASSQPNTQPSRYLFIVPNLTKAQCQAKAQQMALDISQHERTASIEVASLAIFTPVTVFQVKGTGTDYDMVYYPQSITVSGSFQEFTTQVQGKFSSPLYLYDDETGVQMGQQS